MANTINVGKADRGTAGRGRLGGRRGDSRTRRTIGLAAIALLILGLATGAIIGRARTGMGPVAPQADSNPFANDPHVYTQWDFREDRREPAPAGALDPEQQDRTQVAPGPVSAGASTTVQFGPDDYAAVPPGIVAAPPSARPAPWGGTCRAGSSDCLPDEDYLPGQIR